jgi:hypothetical protein
MTGHLEYPGDGHFGSPIPGHMHFPGLVVEPLVVDSLRNAYEKTCFRMGYITYFRSAFLLRSAAHSEGPGRPHGPGPWAGPHGPDGPNGSHRPMGLWDHGSRKSMDSIDFLGSKAPSEIRQEFDLEIHVEISHGAHGIFPREGSMEPMACFPNKKHPELKNGQPRVLQMTP